MDLLSNISVKFQSRLTVTQRLYLNFISSIRWMTLDRSLKIRKIITTLCILELAFSYLTSSSCFSRQSVVPCAVWLCQPFDLSISDCICLHSFLVSIVIFVDLYCYFRRSVFSSPFLFVL